MTVEALVAAVHDLSDVLTAPSSDGRSVVEALAIVGKIKRLADGVGIGLAGDLVTLSDPALERPLAKSLGERSPEAVLQAYAGLDPAEAIAWCCIGVATRPQISLLGETLPPRHEALSAALADGSIRVGNASRVLGVLDEIAPYSSIDERAAVESFLIGEAPKLSDRGFARVCAELPSRFVPDRHEDRDAMERRRAGVAFRRARHGGMQLVVDLHAEAEGFIRTALDARTAPRRQPSFLDGAGLDGAALDGADLDGADLDLADLDLAEADTRPLRQKRLDALVGIMRDSLGSDPGTVAGTSVTMHVTVDLAVLQGAPGCATISGVDRPLPASAARRLAASAEIIPVVLGGDSEPLDLGRSARLASASQRSALAIRDGGCIWPRCEAPPGWCEVAHVTAWAEGGSTDLDNLVLFCAFHHRCFDHDDWQLMTRDGRRYLIPPAWVDRARTPRPIARPDRVAA
jgi:hypothetical protein